MSNARTENVRLNEIDKDEAESIAFNALDKHKQVIDELVAAAKAVEDYLWDDEWEGMANVKSALARAKTLEAA